MKIPNNFAFSQNNLQDFVDCPRRFELRYLEKLSWPAVRSEPVLEVERHMLMGEQFHIMVQQYQSGLPAEQIAVLAGEPELQAWWQAYLDYSPKDLPPVRKVEHMLTAPFMDYRLVAKYDMLAIEPGKRAIIIDWKTNQSRPTRQTLRKRIQTHIYPFLLVEAGKTLNGRSAIQPDQVELRYWFTADPQNPEHFPYSAIQYDEDRAYLQDLIKQIEAAADSHFILTSVDRMCRFCNYRSLCDRGDKATWTDEEDLEQEDISSRSGFDLDFENIGEIIY